MGNELTLGVAISTVGRNLSGLIDLLRQLSQETDEVLLVVQAYRGYEQQLDETRKITNVRLVLDEGIGLSRSRNLAIRNTTCDYLWFLDDDVALVNNPVSKMKKCIEGYRDFVNTFRIIAKEGGKPYKKYSNKRVLSRLDLLKVSSIEIVIPVGIVRRKDVYFREDFGLGTNRPTSAENLFLIDMYRSGIPVCHHPLYVISHPRLDRRKLLRRPEILFTKGIVAREVGRVIGLFLLIRWGYRALRQGVSLDLLRYLWQGYSTGKT
jgi:hypothetical protein